MRDPSEGFTRRELYAIEDETRAEIERDLVDVNDEIQGIQGDLIFWRKQSRGLFWRERSARNLEQQHEAARELVSLPFRLMKLTRERVLLERQADAPSEITAWE